MNSTNRLPVNNSLVFAQLRTFAAEPGFSVADAYSIDDLIFWSPYPAWLFPRRTRFPAGSIWQRLERRA